MKAPAFDAQAFLDSAGVARKVREFKKKEAIFSQGDAAKNVLYIQKGAVRLSVVNETGKEAVVAVLGSGDFFGEGCLAGQMIRIGSATAITVTNALVIEKKEMIRVLHAEHAFSDRFISYMLSRNIRVEEDLVDQLFNSSEKRLARTLLLLARYGKEDKPQRAVSYTHLDVYKRQVSGHPGIRTTVGPTRSSHPNAWSRAGTRRSVCDWSVSHRSACRGRRLAD